ncbi:unnamed protein product [Vicia faba]|uniref:Uncharacterized protein n=1 Tax=Vicia faba TaxID=3906 RepID=A0AAV1ALI2_VICFA|nr:unnamed protein product [Vicia faba]
MMRRKELFEMDSRGDYFTWSNKRIVGTIYSRIDRVLGNVDWSQAQLNTTIKILPPSVSDHALLYLSNHVPPRHVHRFQFINCIMWAEGYKDVVKSCWDLPLEGSTMFVLWKKLRRLQPVLRKLNKPLICAKQNISKAISNLIKA